jgi:RNA polymerase sigma factor (sigma-70 family)
VSKPPNATDPAHSVASQELLIDKHTPKLFSFLLHRLRFRSRSVTPAEDAEDLLQTVFMRFCATSRRELIRKPEPYLYRIAENVLKEFRLRQDRDVVIFDSKQVKNLLIKQDEAAEESVEWVEDPFEQTASDEQLNRVLAQIPAMYGAVLVLRARDSLSFEKIAETLGITLGTARVYLYRALAACRAADWNR